MGWQPCAFLWEQHLISWLCSIAFYIQPKLFAQWWCQYWSINSLIGEKIFNANAGTGAFLQAVEASRNYPGKTEAGYWEQREQLTSYGSHGQELWSAVCVGRLCSFLLKLRGLITGIWIPWIARANYNLISICWWDTDWLNHRVKQIPVVALYQIWCLASVSTDT